MGGGAVAVVAGCVVSVGRGHRGRFGAERGGVLQASKKKGILKMAPKGIPNVGKHSSLLELTLTQMKSLWIMHETS